MLTFEYRAETTATDQALVIMMETSSTEEKLTT